MDKEKENVQNGQQENADHTAKDVEESLAQDKNSEQDQSNPKHEDVSSVDSKEQSKQKTYTQEEVDAMMARARKKYTKNSDSKEESQEETVTVENQQQQRDLSTGITVDKLARAELKAQMAVDGVNPSKLVYACRMIDVADVLDESGQYSEEKAKTAIEEMLKVMPELKATSQQEQNSFYFGAPEQEEQNSQQEQKNTISKIFGN